MSQSVKKNFAWNLILTCSGYVLPLITYPYISRVLGVGNIGICGYVDSIIDYLILFSALGVGSLGVREIARVKEDANQLREVFSSLLFFNTAMTILSCLVLVILAFTVPRLYEIREYVFIGLVKLISNAFLIEWFFKGLQDFRFITIRSLSIRVLYVFAVFAFIHTSNDVWIYYLLNSLMVLINSVVNYYYSRRFTRFSFGDIHLRKYISRILGFGYYLILTSLYTSFNTLFLGSVCPNEEVGYYVTATKLYTILMSVISAFTAVMVPKVAELLSSGKNEELQHIADSIFPILVCLSLPLIFFCQFFAQEIILLISGPGYEGAITPFRIIIMLVLIIGMEQIVISQFLMAADKAKPVSLLASLGAIVGLSINFLLTPKIGAIGSAVSWGISESVVLIAAIYTLPKYISIKIRIVSILEEILCSLLYIVPLIVFSFIDTAFIRILLSLVSFTILFVFINFIWRKKPALVSIKDSVVYRFFPNRIG